MAKDEEKKQVVFRRIRGRLVPIAIGSSAIAASRRIDLDKVAKFGYRNADTGTRVRKNTRASFNRKIQKNFQAKTSLYKVKVLNKALNFHGSDSFAVTEGGYRFIAAPTKSQVGFAHELGHAEQHFKNTWLSRLGAKARKRLVSQPSAREAGQKALTFFHRKIEWRHNVIRDNPGKFRPFVIKLGMKKQRLKNAAISMPIIAHEADAWIKGYSMAPKRLRKFFYKPAARGLTSYAAIPLAILGKAGLVAAGAGLIGYGLLRKNNGSRP